jgi:septal ring factor EnvC (AmiA/AmiB activator)
MNSTPNRKATEPADVLIVHADKPQAHAYQQIAYARYQKFAPAARVTKYTLNPKATEPDDARIARADERLAQAYEQIARTDEQLARVTEQLSKLEQDATRHRSAAPGRLPLPGRPALRGLIGFLLAACIFVAAFVSQSPYGDAVNQIIARWAPQLILTSSLLLKNPMLPVRPSPSAPQVAAEPMPPTPSAQAAPQEVAPTAASRSPELTQMLQMMARDLANVEQGIEQLKTSQERMTSDNAKAIEQLKRSQEQMARDNAKAIEQLKTSQEQAARDNAKAAEQLKASQEKMAGFIAKVSKPNSQARTSAPPSRPIATPTR